MYVLIRLYQGYREDEVLKAKQLLAESDFTENLLDEEINTCERALSLYANPVLTQAPKDQRSCFPSLSTYFSSLFSQSN